MKLTAHDWFRRGLIWAALFVYFINYPIYLHALDDSRLPPKVWVTVIAALSIFVAYRSVAVRTTLASPLSVWAGFVIVLASIWVAAFTPTDPDRWQAYVDLCVGLISILVLQFVFAGDRHIQDFGQRAMAACVLISALVIAYEFFNPFSIVPVEAEFANPGRAGGFYINANIAGAAIVIGAIASLDAIPMRFRPAFIAGLSLAVVMTMSRAAILGWVVVVILMMWNRRIPAKGTFWVFGVTAFLALLAFPIAYQILAGLGLGFDNVVERAGWFFDPLGAKDESALERTAMLELGWKYFIESPLFGHGLGVTRTWEALVGSHNMFMELMLEFGILGLFIFPAFLAAIYVRREGTQKAMVVELVLFFALTGFFSHNMFTAYPIIAGIGLISAISATRFAESKSLENASPKPSAALLLATNGDRSYGRTSTTSS